MNITRKAAIAGAGLLSILGVGGGVALAASSPSTTPPAPATSAPATPAPPNTPAAQTPAAQTPEAPEAPETPGAPEAAETPGVEEPGDANLPGGGHADPPGQNVDHQFEGVE